MQGVCEYVEREYEGIYRAHWELACLLVKTGQKRILCFGPRVERWWPEFPTDFELPWSEQFGGQPVQRIKKPRYFAMRFLAIPGPVGRFGHRGTCRREARITKVIEAVEIAEPWIERAGIPGE